VPADLEIHLIADNYSTHKTLRRSPKLTRLYSPKVTRPS
jgi:hypothetical protein